jgi:long-chain acyl-CoA synthetase
MPESNKTELNVCDTWPKVLKHNAEKYGARAKAMRYKHYGIWQAYSWHDYYQNVKYLALGLLSVGFQAGDKLLIAGDNAPEWYFAELAAQSNQGASVGLYSDLSPSEMKYMAINSGSRFAMVEDQEQVDKLLEIEKDLSGLKKIIYWKCKGLFNYKNPLLIGYREVCEQGREYEKDHPDLFEENIIKGKADDICALVYTSGATSEDPKCAVHTHRTLRYGSESHLQRDRWTEKDNLISYLPPAWITEQWLSLGCQLLSGSIVNFSEGAETQQQDIREIGPSVLFYNSRLWERQAGSVLARIQASDFLKKSLYRLLMPISFKLEDLRLEKRKPGLHLRMLGPIADYLMCRPIRDSLGLPHARFCYTAGSALSPDVIRFYHALNVPLKVLYGSTEAGAITGSLNDDTHLDTVGMIHRGTEIRIGHGGEILVRQPGSFAGYYNDTPATSQVLCDGWVLTGDRGLLTDEGYLKFIDRAKDMVTLSSGDVLAPQQVECRLKFSPYINDAWVFAEPGRSFAAAVIIIDNNSVGKWADKKKVSYTTFSDLSQKPEVYDLIRQELARVNEGLPAGTRLRKFANLHKRFDADEFELTRNRKLRRGYLAERYNEIVRAVYSDRKDVSIEAQFSYKNGRTGVLKTSVQIMGVGEEGK